MGVTVGRKITIGEQMIIGAGSVVVKDLPSYVVAYGVPAKAVRDRKAEEKYF
jgi:acetyltransferase-like isoleucine patch superfamily enzyme